MTQHTRSVAKTLCERHREDCLPRSMKRSPSRIGIT
jgi:hypothetical protein